MHLQALDYREASLQRLEEAIVLYENKRWVGAVYLAGRAVEAMFRALLWRRGERDVGHNLRTLLARVGQLGLLTEHDREHLIDRVNDVAIVWNNDLRFAAARKFSQHLKAAKRHRRIAGRATQGDAAKANAKAVREASEAIVARGDLIWKR